MSLELKIVSSILAVGIAVEMNDYIDNKSYIKKLDWLKQNNKEKN